MWFHYIFNHYNVIVWTASVESYAIEICSNIFSKDMNYKLLTRVDCTLNESMMSFDYYEKDILKLYIPLKEIICIDDNKKCYLKHLDNLILVKYFYIGFDDVLLDVIAKLKTRI